MSRNKIQYSLFALCAGILAAPAVVYAADTEFRDSFLQQVEININHRDEVLVGLRLYRRELLMNWRRKQSRDRGGWNSGYQEFRKLIRFERSQLNRYKSRVALYTGMIGANFLDHFPIIASACQGNERTEFPSLCAEYDSRMTSPFEVMRITFSDGFQSPSLPSRYTNPDAFHDLRR